MAGGGPLVTKTLLIVNSGGRDVEDMQAVARTITAYDKDTGEYLGSVELPVQLSDRPTVHPPTRPSVVIDLDQRAHSAAYSA